MKHQPFFDQWCRTAAGYVPRSRRSAIYSELYGHLQDHYLDLIQNGRDDEAAVRLAITAMGDPDEVGRQLRRSEWSLHGIVRRICDFFVGSQWVCFYRGTDERRYTALRQLCAQSGIEHRVEELDALSRTVGSMNTPGRYPMDNTPRRDGTVTTHLAASQFKFWSGVDPVYAISVRKRDLPALQRLERT